MRQRNKPVRAAPASSSFHPSRRSAFRAAKRFFGIPQAQGPQEVIRPNTRKGNIRKLTKENKRLYIFKVIRGLFGRSNSEVHIREDRSRKYFDGGRQADHFNAGQGGRKLKKHFYFRSKK